MLHSIEFFGVNSSPPILPVTGNSPGTDPIQIRDVQGLGPVAASITTAPYGTLDGEAILGASVGKRNIVIKFGLNPDWATQTMQDLRRHLYRYFFPRHQVRLRIVDTDGPTVEIDGTVESMEPNIFSKDPEIDVSIICPQPEFRSLQTQSVEGVIGSNYTPFALDYIGNVPAGVVFTLKATDAKPAYSGPVALIFRDPALNFLHVEVTINLDHYFRINSLPGKKALERVNSASGLTTSLLQQVPSDVRWPVLMPGTNQLSVSTVTPDSIGLAYELEWTPIFGAL